MLLSGLVLEAQNLDIFVRTEAIEFDLMPEKLQVGKEILQKRRLRTLQSIHEGICSGWLVNAECLTKVKRVGCKYSKCKHVPSTND